MYLGFEGSSENLAARLKLDEGTGTTAFDSSGNSNPGSIFEALWNNDNINITLTDAIDYSISGSTFTILNAVYIWTGIDVNWVYSTGEDICGLYNTDSLKNTFRSFVYGIITFLGIIGVIIGIVWMISYLRKLFNKKEGVTGFAGN